MIRISKKLRTLDIGGMLIGIRRDSRGVIELKADDERQIAAGIGFAHAHDRLVQMALFRLVGQGRLSECLKSGEQQLGLDIFSRMMGFARYAEEEVVRCSPRALAVAEAYCLGVNHYLRQFGVPMEFKLLGYQPERWTVADVLTGLKLLTYGMAHSQRMMERALVEAIRDVPRCPNFRGYFRRT